MEGIQILFCDDEPEARSLIAASFLGILKENGFDVTCIMVANIKEAAKKLNKQLIDLIVLDIDLPGTSGIDFGKQLRANNNGIPIIFVSNREDKVFDSLKIEPLAFVRKSHILEDLPDAIKRFVERRKAFLEKKLVVENRDRIISLPISEIIYIEGARNNQVIHNTLSEETINIRKNMQQLDEELQAEGFIRIHKGYLVNYKFIRLIQDSYIILTNGERLPVSRRRIQDVKRSYLLNMQSGGAII